MQTIQRSDVKNVSGVGRVRGLSTSEPKSTGDEGVRGWKGAKLTIPELGCAGGSRKPWRIACYVEAGAIGRRSLVVRVHTKESEGVSTTGTKSGGNGGDLGGVRLGCSNAQMKLLLKSQSLNGAIVGESMVSQNERTRSI